MSSVSTVATGVRAITHDDMPELFRTASDWAGRDKRLTRRLTAAELVLLTLAAAAQLITHNRGQQIADVLGIEVSGIHVLWFSVDSTYVRNAIGASVVYIISREDLQGHAAQADGA